MNFPAPNIPLGRASKSRGMTAKMSFRRAELLKGVPEGFEVARRRFIVDRREGLLLIPHVAVPRLFPEANFTDYEFLSRPSGTITFRGSTPAAATTRRHRTSAIRAN